MRNIHQDIIDFLRNCGLTFDLVKFVRNSSVKYSYESLSLEANKFIQTTSVDVSEHSDPNDTRFGVAINLLRASYAYTCVIGSKVCGLETPKQPFWQAMPLCGYYFLLNTSVPSISM